MAQTLTGIVEATPFGTPGTFDAKSVRLSTLGNLLPGLFAPGDFSVSQRAAGANQSVDVAQGRAFIDPQVSTHQGLYLARRTNAVPYNTLSDGGMTWTASDPSNPRIDILGITLQDNAEDASGSTGWKFSVQVGTAQAGATHQLEAQLWPVFPTGFLPLAAVLRPAASTSIVTSNITNLNPMGGEGRSAALSIPTAETTASATYARLATPDVVVAYVPPNGRLRVMYEGLWKVAAAGGTQSVTLFINGIQLKFRAASNGVPVAAEFGVALSTFLGTITTTQTSAGGFFGSAGATADVTEVATGMLLSSGSSAASAVDVVGLPAGWYATEARYKTSGGSAMTIQNRRTWAEVIG